MLGIFKGFASIHYYKFVYQFALKLIWHLNITFFSGLLPKQPQLIPHEGYRNQTEFESLEELEALSTDLDSIRIQSLLIAERVLGTHHKDTIFRYVDIIFRYLGMHALIHTPYPILLCHLQVELNCTWIRMRSRNENSI